MDAKNASITCGEAEIVDEQTKEMWEYTVAIELDSQNATGYTKRGRAYYDLGNYPAALCDFNKAIELDSASYSAYHGRGLVY